jgi:opine dehydrogenase
MNIAVLGSGHGGKATAAYLTLRGHSVTMYNRTPERLLTVINEGGVRITGVLGNRFVPIPRFEADLAAACAGADAIFVVVPAVGHDYYAEHLAAIAQPGQLILLHCHSTLGAVRFLHVLRARGSKAGPVAEINSLPFICRTQSDGSVSITGKAKGLKAACLPARAGSMLEAVLSETYPDAAVAETILHVGLTNINAVLHPPGMILNAGHIERTDGDFFFYYDTTPAVAATIEQVDCERLAIMRRLGVLPATPFVQHFYELGYTTQAAAQESSVLKALVESEADRYIKAPSSLDHRYLHEDVGYGLVPMSALGEIAGIRTPVIDALITLASVVNAVDYRATGLSRTRLGLETASTADLLRLVTAE